MTDHLCQLCLKEISNPVCSICYLSHIEKWMVRNRIAKPMQKKIHEKIRKSLILDTNHSDECILCNKENVNLCYFCFYSRAHTIINSFTKVSIDFEPFDSVFNYHHYVNKEEEEIYDSDYYKDLK